MYIYIFTKEAVLDNKQIKLKLLVHYTQLILVDNKITNIYIYILFQLAYH